VKTHKYNESCVVVSKQGTEENMILQFGNREQGIWWKSTRWAWRRD